MLHTFAVDSRSSAPCKCALRALFPTVVVYVQEVEGVNVSREKAVREGQFLRLFVCSICGEQHGYAFGLPEDCQADVDQQISSAACHSIDADGRDFDRLACACRSSPKLDLQRIVRRTKIIAEAAIVLVVLG
jgi:hypothetical protein